MGVAGKRARRKSVFLPRDSPPGMSQGDLAMTSTLSDRPKAMSDELYFLFRDEERPELFAALQQRENILNC